MSDKIIHLNEGAIKQELKELVRQSVEETLNNLLEQEGFMSATHSSQGMISFIIPRNSSRLVFLHRFEYSISVKVCCFICVASMRFLYSTTFRPVLPD
jgi:hypothetical protein